MWWLLTALAWAAPADDEALTRAVQDEISRAMVELSLPDSPPIYHLRAKLALMEQRGALASFGGLVYENRAPHVALGVEVRVGTPAFDNTGFGGWQDGFRIRGLPHEPTERAIRLDMASAGPGLQRRGRAIQPLGSAAVLPPTTQGTMRSPGP